MTPIGILTQNRPGYLDVTLRSLSAARYPARPRVVIFDDASTDPVMRKYLYTTKKVSVEQTWPQDQRWMRAIGSIRSRKIVHGIADTVDVVRLSGTPMGVVNASCKAFRQLRDMYPDAARENGLILLQDDVIFNPDWFTRLHIECAKLRSRGVPLGLLAGLLINQTITSKKSAIPITRKAATAQCYFLQPAGLDAARKWLETRHSIRKGFDDKLTLVLQHHLKVYLINPPVCQHIGVASRVRNRKWRWCSERGRIGYNAKGPYPLADDITCFKRK